mmetsp:Transcript_743/g.1146  ORF Transcript_743/g.1146 Transcript_743/m.1146 type:complete len:177 (+) Transcript_743:51-581(+)
MAGPTSGKQEFSEVAINSIWREQIKRERKSATMNKEFHANPTSVTVVTGKPNQRKKRFLDKDKAQLDSIQKNHSKLLEDDKELLDNPEIQEMLAEEKELEASRKRNQEFCSTLKNSLKKPTERYNKPLTTNHEIGWYSQPLYKSKRWYRPKNRCDETLYADILIKTTNIGKKPEAG